MHVIRTACPTWRFRSSPHELAATVPHICISTSVLEFVQNLLFDTFVISISDHSAALAGVVWATSAEAVTKVVTVTTSGRSGHSFLKTISDDVDGLFFSSSKSHSLYHLFGGLYSLYIFLGERTFERHGRIRATSENAEPLAPGKFLCHGSGLIRKLGKGNRT